jgi:hypothetical protein
VRDAEDAAARRSGVGKTEEPPEQRCGSRRMSRLRWRRWWRGTWGSADSGGGSRAKTGAGGELHRQGHVGGGEVTFSSSPSRLPSPLKKC